MQGGTLSTQGFVEASGKPGYVVPLDPEPEDATVADVLDWLERHDVSVLNMAGPRESERPGIYALTIRFLDRLRAAQSKHRPETPNMSAKTEEDEGPATKTYPDSYDGYEYDCRPERKYTPAEEAYWASVKAGIGGKKESTSTPEQAIDK